MTATSLVCNEAQMRGTFPRFKLRHLRYDVLGDFVKLTGEGRFTVPVARTFALEDWRDTLNLSLGGHAQGKLVLLPAA